jgi:hypothetical protein
MKQHFQNHGFENVNACAAKNNEMGRRADLSTPKIPSLVESLFWNVSWCKSAIHGTEEFLYS